MACALGLGDVNLTPIIIMCVQAKFASQGSTTLIEQTNFMLQDKGNNTKYKSKQPYASLSQLSQASKCAFIKYKMHTTNVLTEQSNT